MKVAIVGGTHGNEFSGIRLIEQWQQHPEQVTRSGLEVELILANGFAYQANRRYMESDLNRQFEFESLADQMLNDLEQTQAKMLNQQLGPKGNSRTDLVIDLHNTTSNMGPTLIILEQNPWELRLAAFVQSQFPEAVILIEDLKPYAEWGYLCTLGKRGVMVEVGPQANSVLRHAILEQMATMTQLILDFASLDQANQLPELPSTITAYRLTGSVSLPLAPNGEPIAMVHKQIEQRDFQPVYHGEPIFQYFDGQVVCHQGEDPIYPHFINEAAYYDSKMAFAVAEQLKVTVP